MEELKLKIEQLEKRVETMEKAQNLDQNVLLFDNLFNKKGTYGADLKRTISLTGNAQDIEVTENPINSLQFNYKGTWYRILLYSLS